MTKRACPFDSHLNRQFKVHLNDYENDENTLRQIQERTLTLLLDGSRRLYSGEISTTNAIGEDPNFKLVQPSENDKKFLQKSVTNYFPFSGKLKNVREQPCNQGQHNMNKAGQNRCTYCDTNTRFLHKCIKCNDTYCSSCCFVNYESADDTRTCLSCS